jgi:hypothetical protein
VLARAALNADVSVTKISENFADSKPGGGLLACGFVAKLKHLGRALLRR